MIQNEINTPGAFGWVFDLINLFAKKQHPAKKTMGEIYFFVLNPPGIPIIPQEVLRFLKCNTPVVLGQMTPPLFLFFPREHKIRLYGTKDLGYSHFWSPIRFLQNPKTSMNILLLYQKIIDNKK